MTRPLSPVASPDSSLEQIGMRASTHEHNRSMLCVFIELVRLHKMTAEMAIPVSPPVTAQSGIAPSRPERSVVGDQQQHRLLEPVHVMAASPRQALPVLQEGLRI